ncbi:SCO family protein [Shewanella sp. GXUN23E]|uniref:SCO family protein n=1 Tax=Shewanella sp. GXUN23E TaxID=3422498 RepID=UPI003D7C4C37
MNKMALAVVGAVMLMGLGIVTAAKWQRPSPPVLATSFIFPEARPLAPFHLADQHGQVFDNSRLLGHWSLMFIGFTSCPDVCPTTMGKLAAAYDGMNAKAPLQVVFVSVDPERDTQAKLASYIEFFNPEFVAATGPHSDLYPLTRQLGMIYSMVGEGDSYTIDHSASMVLIDPEGRKVAVVKPRSDGQSLPQIRLSEMVSDIQAIQQL